MLEGLIESKTTSALSIANPSCPKGVTTYPLIEKVFFIRRILKQQRGDNLQIFHSRFRLRIFLSDRFRFKLHNQWKLMNRSIKTKESHQYVIVMSFHINFQNMRSSFPRKKESVIVTRVKLHLLLLHERIR